MTNHMCSSLKRWNVPHPSRLARYEGDMDSSIHTTPFVGRQVFFNRVLATDISGGVPYIEHDTLSSVSLTSRRPLHPLPLSGTNRGRNPTKKRSNQTSYTNYGSAILPGVERHSLCDLWCLLINGNCARLEVPSGIQERVPFWQQNSDRVSDCFELYRLWLVRKREKSLIQIQSGSGQSMTTNREKRPLPLLAHLARWWSQSGGI